MVIGCGDDGESGKREVQPVSIGQSDNDVSKMQKEGGNDGIGDIDDGVDRISELPEPIIHHVFGFLRSSKDVARTSLLSKKWQSVFNSYQTFDFDETYFHVKGTNWKHELTKARKLQKKKFKKYVENSLASRLEAVPCIEKFRLRVKYMDDPRSCCMNEWICVALTKSIKELEIHGMKENPYTLPDSVLCSTSITCLKLSACVLKCGPTMNLHHLKILSLKEMKVNHDMIMKFEENCPLIEDLRLVSCKGPAFMLTVASARLRRLEVHECPHIFGIEIEAPNLETFWCHSKRGKRCDFDLKACGNLKNLTLKAHVIMDEIIEAWFSNCPLIENLVLQECSKLETLTILSENLKSLSLIKCGELDVANIDAPNLFSFHYTGPGLTLSSFNVLGLREAKFFFGSDVKTSQLFLRNKNFLENFSQSHDLIMTTHSKKDMKIFGEPRQACGEPYSFDKLELCASPTSVLKIIDTWLRDCQGNRLTLLSPSNDLLKAIDKMMRRVGKPNCCSLYEKKCWRDYLKDVKMKNLCHKRVTCYEFKWKISTEE